MEFKDPAIIVLEGLKGKPVVAICQEAFTSYNNLKGNADTEWLIRILKEELLCAEWR